MNNISPKERDEKIIPISTFQDDLQIGILKDNGEIVISAYQLKNIHEFLTVFYQPNIHEEQ